MGQVFSNVERAIVSSLSMREQLIDKFKNWFRKDSTDNVIFNSFELNRIYFIRIYLAYYEQRFQFTQRTMRLDI